MACSIGKGFTRLYKNDTISYSFPRKISNSNYSHSSRINVTDKNGFSLKSCADFEDEVLNSSSEDLDYKIRAFRLSQQPFTEAELLLQLQEEKTNGVLDINGGACERGSSTVFSDGNSLPEKIVVAVDVDEGITYINCYSLLFTFCLLGLDCCSGLCCYEFRINVRLG